ncbi:SusC/RagA family TonB-linked outer membrane protein [uncultured Dokdonia sp.]|uniref:SusC/RagA family TonB-linked outer membrane protein n=1 Tax=unclassified Dokdonia TaxID=2615033 RepID=UPI002630EFE9|nr:SusC/RagA family TonB-linked outer membrane protein [uncultured Dokdonia sp.]
MKTKFSGILTLLLAFVVQVSFAQTTVSGTVTEENGPLPGANVIIKGTSTGTQTDFDGNYSIQASATDVLVFSFVGFTTKEVTVGGQTTINIGLAADNALEEVIVTAQGIKREKKALGYAVTSISSEEIENKPVGDVGRLLQGKAPGVRITSTGGVAGSGTNIIIRGYSSIGGSNQPLFIVDGVPFSSDTNQSGSFITSSNTASRFGDLDPNNIESMSVLKGLSATALYGEEGKNGVILITTKSGANRKNKTEVTVSSSLFFNEIRLPDYQNTYGGGFFQDYGPFFSNWGSAFSSQETIPNAFLGAFQNIDRFDGVLPSEVFPGRTDLDATSVEYRPYDSQEQFFRTGVISNTSINLAGSSMSKDGRASNFSLNYSHLEDQSFVPGNTVRRNNFSLGGAAELSNNFSISGKLSYAKFDKTSPMTDASFGSDVFGAGIASIWNVLYIPRSVDLFGSPSSLPDTGESIWYRAGNDRTNPLWVVDNTRDNNLTNRLFGNTNVTYKFTDDISLTYRYGLDYYAEDQFRAINAGANDGARPFGYLSTITNQNTIHDHSVLFNLDKDIIEDDLRLTFTGALNLRRNEFSQVSVQSDRQLANAFGLFRHSVFENRLASSGNFTSEENNNAVYGNATLDYGNWAFLNLSARNDWSSVFEEANRSVFSYGGSMSIDVTGAIPSIKNTFVDYLKVRAGYGQAPGFASPYSTRPNLGINSQAFNLGGNNIATNNVQNFLPNPDLKPELSKEFEVGMEARLFNNRVSFDFTYYNKDTEDQIINRPLPAESGFTSFADNFGNVNNKGIELGFRVVPVKSENFVWSIDGNYNVNENIVTDTDGQTVQIAGFGDDLGNYAIEDQAFGIIQGSRVARDENGNLLVDDTGFYVTDSNIGVIADPNPDWTMSLVNGFRYKNWNLTAQIEYQHGGDMFLRTVNTLAARGLTTDTDFDRTQTFILNGVNQNTGQPNTVQLAPTEAYFDNYGFGADEFNVYDVTNIRLRELAVGYSFPAELLENTPFGSLSITAQGYNLFVEAVNTPKGVNFDPDVNSVGVGNGFGFDFLTSWNSRRYGASVKVTF